MRTAAGIVLAAVVAISLAHPASACDPESDWCGWREPQAWSPPEIEERWSPPEIEERWSPPEVDERQPVAPAPWRELPEYTPWEPPAVYSPPAPVERVYEPPAREIALEPRNVEPPVRTDPIVEAVTPWAARVDRGDDDARAIVVPDRWDEAARIGAHRVTDAYAGDMVTRDGRTTTYATATVHELIDTVARVFTQVGTGEASGLESVLWNGRARRADGTFVRGTIYENFVWNGEAWVHDKLVFFQDDSETEPLAAPPPPVAPVDAPPPAPAPLAPPPFAPLPREPAPAAIAPPSGAQPPDREAPGAPPAAAPAAAAPSAPTSHDVRAGIALAPEGDALAAVEVLRGRAIRLWPRALVDGAPARVSAWRIRAAELTALGPLAGSADAPLVAMWERVSAAGTAFTVAVDVDVEVPGGTRTVQATIAVTVRSPALVE